MEYKEKYCPACGKWRSPEVLFHKVIHPRGKGYSYRCEFCNQVRKQTKKMGEIKPYASNTGI